MEGGVAPMWNRKRRKPTTLTVGEISHGSDNFEGWISDFLWELQRLRLSPVERRAVQRIRRDLSTEGYYALRPDTASEDFDTLVEIADNHCPPYMYLSHRGNDWVVAVDDDMSAYFDGLRVDDLLEVPHDYRGEVLHVNDHGNMTLYWKHRNGFKEIWAVV